MIFENNVLALMSRYEVGAYEITGVRNTVLNALDAEAFDQWLIQHILTWADQFISEVGLPSEEAERRVDEIIALHSKRLFDKMMPWTNDQTLMYLYSAFLTYFQARQAFLDDTESFQEFEAIVDAEVARRA